MSAETTTISGFAHPPAIGHFLHYSSLLMEVMGVAVILIGSLVASAYFLRQCKRGQSLTEAFSAFRLHVARGILLGLEFLVAADIIGTVLVAPTMENVLILGVIVLMRTFLSYSLEIEIHGRFPWRAQEEKKE